MMFVGLFSIPRPDSRKGSHKDHPSWARVNTGFQGSFQDKKFTQLRTNLESGQTFFCSAPIKCPDEEGTQADKRVANPGAVPHSSRSRRLGRSSRLLCVFQDYLFQNGKFQAYLSISCQQNKMKNIFRRNENF